MKPCRACSYTPATEPKIFCPACGAMWDKAKPPSPDRKTKVPTTTAAVKKPSAKATTAKTKPTTTSGRAKRNPTKKKG